MDLAEFNRLTPYVPAVVNVTISDVVEVNGNSLPNMRDLLTRIIPGNWSLPAVSKIFAKQFGQQKFDPSYVVTDEVELTRLFSCLNIDFLRSKSGMDPFAGNCTIEKRLTGLGVFNFKSNDINPMMHETNTSTSHLDAVDPRTLKKWQDDKIFYIITSAPFFLLDLCIPLLVITFDFVVIQVPSGYLSPLPRDETSYEPWPRRNVYVIYYPRNEKMQTLVVTLTG